LAEAEFWPLPDRRPSAFVFTGEGCGNQGRAVVKKPIVVNETEARQATKEGVVRYILLVSLVLVVVLFVVAYVFFR
jgi:high-affinity K+ transport system ATPase subunit B